MAIANRYTGKDLYAEFICSSGVIPLTGDQTMFTISKQVDLYEITPGDSSEKEYVSNIREGEVEIELLDVGGAAALAIDTVLDAGVVGTLVYAPKGTSNPYTDPKRGFPVIVQGKTFNYPYDEVCEVNLAFKKVGSAVWGGTATWNYSDEAILYLKQDGNANNSALRASGGVGVQAAISNNVIYPAHIVPQVGTAAGQYAESIINLHTNPSAETGTAGWNAYQCTIAQSSDYAKVGSYSFKNTRTGGTGAFGQYVAFVTGAPLPVTTYTTSAWVWVSADVASRCFFRSYLAMLGGAVATNYGLYTDTVLSAGWNKVGTTATVDEVDRTQVQAIYYLRDSSPGDLFYIDGIQVEERAYPTPYCDGSLGEGHYWTGTAHGSTSYRVTSQMYFDLTMPAAWSVSTWLKTPYDIGNNPTNQVTWSWSYDSGDRITFFPIAAQNDLIAEWITSGGANGNVTATDGLPGPMVWAHCVVTWNGTTLEFFKDNVSIGTATPAAFGNTPTKLWIGQWLGNAQFNGFIDEFLVFDRALSATDVTAIYNRGAAGNPA